MTPRVCIMAAGAFKRFNLDYGSGRIPKPLATFNGVPNVARTMRLATEINPSVEIYASFPKGKTTEYSDVVSPHFSRFHVIEGQSDVEGWKFRNIMHELVPFVTVLYGDVYYHPDDLSLIMSYPMDDLDGAFFCYIGFNVRRLCPSEKDRATSEASYIGKNGSEGTGWRIGENIPEFLAAIERDAQKAGDRGTSYSLYNLLNPERRRMIGTSTFTTDFDGADDYKKMVKYWEEHGG